MEKNIKWHSSKVTIEDRENSNNHKGCVIWMTGLSASGKSTIAVELEKKLFDLGCHIIVLDGDNIRHGLNSDLGFSEESRHENIRRLAELCKILRFGGFIVISAFISPYRKERDFARSLVEDDRFLEVFVQCSIKECIHRDPKGMYDKAIKGIIPNYTGISAPYEEPEKPEIILDTEHHDLDACVQTIIDKLKQSKIIL